MVRWVHKWEWWNWYKTTPGNLHSTIPTSTVRNLTFSPVGAVEVPPASIPASDLSPSPVIGSLQQTTEQSPAPTGREEPAAAPPSEAPTAPSGPSPAPSAPQAQPQGPQPVAVPVVMSMPMPVSSPNGRVCSWCYLCLLTLSCSIDVAFGDHGHRPLFKRCRLCGRH